MANVPEYQNDQLEQQLWELAYGLLDDSDAAELQRRIDDEPTVTDLWMKVKDQVDMVASATRYEAEPIVFVPPAELASRNGTVISDMAADMGKPPELDRTSSSSKSGWSWRTFANWATPIAAAAVLCVALAPQWLASLIPAAPGSQGLSDSEQQGTSGDDGTPLRVISPEFVDESSTYFVSYQSSHPIEVEVRDESERVLLRRRFRSKNGSFALPNLQTLQDM